MRVTKIGGVVWVLGEGLRMNDHSNSFLPFTVPPQANLTFSSLLPSTTGPHGFITAPHDHSNSFLAPSFH